MLPSPVTCSILNWRRQFVREKVMWIKDADSIPGYEPQFPIGRLCDMGPIAAPNLAPILLTTVSSVESGA